MAVNGAKKLVQFFCKATGPNSSMGDLGVKVLCPQRDRTVPDVPVALCDTEGSLDQSVGKPTFPKSSQTNEISLKHLPHSHRISDCSRPLVDDVLIDVMV